MEKKKVGFASGIGFILAAAGSAVGLGNLWGFPYKTSQNGGAAVNLPPLYAVRKDNVRCGRAHRRSAELLNSPNKSEI